MTLRDDIDVALRAIIQLDERISVLESIHHDEAITHRTHRSEEEYEFYHAARAACKEADAEMRKLRYQAQYGYIDGKESAG